MEEEEERQWPAEDGLSTTSLAPITRRSNENFEGRIIVYALLLVIPLSMVCFLWPSSSLNSTTKCAPINACLNSFYNETLRNCSTVPIGSGFPCDDGNLCTENDECDGDGKCVGIPISLFSDIHHSKHIQV